MATRSIDGHRLDLTNLDKVLYPATGTTKGDVIDYLVAIAPAMLPHLALRPVTRKRWPDGVRSDSFFERSAPNSLPDWIPRRTIRHKKRAIDYPLIDSPAALAQMGQLAALELHVPQWTFAGAERGPVTRLVFDLDPGEGAGLEDCVAVAFTVRDALADAGLTSFPVTSGSKGIHVYAGLRSPIDSSDASTVARELARGLDRAFPDRITATMTKSRRAGKVLIDWSQNNANKTTVAPYSLRGREHPTVAAPRTWDELDGGEPGQLRFDEVLERYRADGDPMADALDSLHTYRSKRRRSRTPEPMPENGPRADERVAARNGEARFVIQEHHARRLHWDLRLEHHGVLVSWAVPKGLPTDSSQNRLAVHTEDHPLEYLTFTGTIPKGEYGAGTMEIFDSGTYAPIKWETDEVLVELHGKRTHGQYALVRTDGTQWLVHRIRKDRERAVPSGAEPDGGSVQLPTDLTPMLATLGSADDLTDMPADEWAFEGKWDGVRVLAEIGDGELRLRSRSGRDLTDTVPELAPLGTALADHDAVLDGELVTLDDSGTSSFAALQNRIGRRRPGAELRERYPIRLFAFDLLHLDGTSLLRRTYSERRRVLEKFAELTEELTVPPALEGDAEHALAESTRRGWEGIVAKRRDSVYLPGQRGSAWVKVKNHRTQEVVIGGWTEGRGRRSGTVGALLLGIPTEDGLRYVGKVGTGFTRESLADLSRGLGRLARKTSPFVGDVPTPDRKSAHWVTPREVGEITFTEWTGSGRLRHPSWRGLRPDKSAAQVRVE
jgi:bifunctional non-homologous end joining protein LigD